MFCDLIGSTALSSRLDPEDLREVIRGYQACVASTIQQFNGFIARYVGDGVLIYFGWPEAHETDAERAVRAGLAVAAAVSGTEVGGEPLQVRVGIATGLVGRDEELELLLRRWTQVKDGKGRVVLISAEPGVGKSRLAEALAGRIAAEPHIRLRYFCSPHHQDSALYPGIAQMERAAGFAL